MHYVSSSVSTCAKQDSKLDGAEVKCWRVRAYLFTGGVLDVTTDIAEGKVRSDSGLNTSPNFFALLLELSFYI